MNASPDNQRTAWSPEVIMEGDRVMGDLVNELKIQLRDMTEKYLGADARAKQAEYRWNIDMNRRGAA